MKDFSVVERSYPRKSVEFRQKYPRKSVVMAGFLSSKKCIIGCLPAGYFQAYHPYGEHAHWTSTTVTAFPTGQGK